ncbi:hypothetical protein evm_014837 [Chilo suppressalis]|nr:hypothetical protein evm_014837 [Chilo suppressalis]
MELLEQRENINVTYGWWKVIPASGGSKFKRTPKSHSAMLGRQEDVCANTSLVFEKLLQPNQLDIQER